ncbi:BREX-1 system adenine-specific DNA-methyltransferase PglX [uncultured Megasphaera sp.]|uniref:BREX-1 system adenine-specific DNA-methyltransferase PglX n=1 Tax=uncultured Megasphaera sp. TaxID=165188 RepID=UPI0025FC90A9|nr:BREX-1 system adenine-specific DNA-methyltransferase PglX [uncultured Megasphaera sp.]
MNKTAIRNFATWARVTLQENMRQRAALLGITPTAILEPLPVSTSEIQYFDMGTATPLTVEGTAVRTRKKLTERLLQDRERDYGTAYQDLIETMASTWFNRLIAIRYMEVNDYFPDHMRVLSSDVPDKVDPDLVSTPFESDLEFTPAEEQQILDWKDHNQNDALFNFLLRKRCHEIGQWMPDFFEGDDDVSDYFLQFSYIDPNGVVSHLIHDIPEEDFQDQVQIIGWLYQYYNSEWKDEVFAKLKKNVKVSKENIPAATQLFTPDWIVRYMVENSLGRLWLAGHPDDELQAKWKYYVPEAQQEAGVAQKLAALRADYARLQSEDLTVMDPCSGSGHILVYAFDVLMDIYLSQGYTEREAAQSILAHNLYGLDIDDRAYQLTYFSLMMKARQYDRRLFSRELRPQVCAIEESNGLTKWSDMRGQVEAEQMSLEDQFVNLADELIDTFRDAKNYGSLLQVEPGNYDGLLDYMQQLLDEGCNNLFLSGWLQEVAERMPKLVRQAKLLRQKYWVCVTNPPYMGAGNMNPILGSFMKKCYPNSKSDLSTAFMERCLDFLVPSGFMAMINIPVWMFLSSYEKLRHIIATQDTYISMAHLGRGVFGSDFGTTAFVIGKKRIPAYQGTYFRLFEKQGAVDSVEQKRQWFLGKKGIYTAKQECFIKIPGEPIAYWVSDNFIQCYSLNKIGDVAVTREGMTTANNDAFIRLWHEVGFYKIGINISNRQDAKQSMFVWFPYAKGGDYRKWYGNINYVVNWENDGESIRTFKDIKNNRIRSHNYNLDYIFKECLSWTRLTSYSFCIRYYPAGFLCDTTGGGLYTEVNIKNIQGLLSSNVVNYMLQVQNPTVVVQAGDVARIPFKQEILSNNQIFDIVNENISISKADWDSFETSWDFQTHPLLVPSALDMAGLITAKQPTLAERYEQFKAVCEDRFDILQENEEELNRIFIDIYGLKDELTPDVAPKDVTVHQIFDSKDDVPDDLQGSNYVLTKEDVMKSFLSYAVGCLFGRYSLDTPGLAYAGGEWDAGKYQTFIPDDDNVVPITDEEYFDDDLPSFICAWLKKAFGRENFEANLEFLTDALGTRGATPKEKLRNYFLKNFYKDHCKTYQKRPIYWLFDSGKENGFKAFVYIHRWTKDTEGRVLLYLHKVQSKYETELRAIDMNLENLSDKRRAARLEKRKDHLQKQLAEIKDYDEILDHMANEQLTMDLDDGVKVNYEKMQTDREGVTYPILAKLK